jgi:integrase
MPQLKLTEKAIAKLAAPDPSGKQVLHWDTELKGFAVLSSGVSNSKTFIVQRTLADGRSRRVTIGAVNELTLIKARDRAADALDSLRRGLDPKAKAPIVPTLRLVLTDYLAARKDLKPATVRLYRFVVEQKLADWLDKPLTEIDGNLVEARHRAIAAEIGRDPTRYKGTGTANTTMVVLRILWNHAADRFSDLPQSPTRRLRRQWYDEPRRTRIVRADDMPKFYQAVLALPNPVARDWFLLMMYSGLRRSEAGSLRWDDVDFSQELIHVRAVATKANRALDLPMSDVVRDLLVARRALGNAGGFVFPANNAHGHVVDTSVPIEQIEKACGIRISAHDLRRTYVTTGESLDVSPYALKAIINHSLSGDVTARYVVFGVERLRPVVQQIADRLKQLAGLSPVTSGKLTKMNRRLG